MGSRLLFRGYGVTDEMKPIQAGLLGSDALILLDEAHLSEPFRQTARAISTVETLRGADAAPFHVALLTATPGEDKLARDRRFTLGDEDRANDILAVRLQAPKPAILRETPTGDAARGESLARHALELLKTLEDGGIPKPAIGVVANRVARARTAFERLRGELGEANVLLVIGRSRGVDRDRIAPRLDPIKTGATPRPDAPLIVVVATQTLEAGVDIDLDGLVTDAASLDALR